MARIDAFLKLGTQQGCSDIHLAVGVPPMASAPSATSNTATAANT